jgi:hypothetical protein
MIWFSFYSDFFGDFHHGFRTTTVCSWLLLCWFVTFPQIFVVLGDPGKPSYSRNGTKSQQDTSTNYPEMVDSKRYYRWSKECYSRMNADVIKSYLFFKTFCIFFHYWLIIILSFKLFDFELTADDMKVFKINFKNFKKVRKLKLNWLF